MDRVNPRQSGHECESREEKEHARRYRTRRTVEEPAGVDGELVRLGTGEQHREVQRVEEPLLVDPATTLHEFLVHDRDLSGRAAEVDEAELDPERKGIPEGNLGRHHIGHPATIPRVCFLHHVR
jgi:hypothetical protein